MVNTLLIDNQKLISDCLSVVFNKKELGINLTIASSCEFAKKELLNQNINVILMDIDIEKEKKIEFINHLKREYLGTKIIVIADAKDKHLLFKIWMYGVNAILSKKCGIELLANTIKQVNNGQRIISKNIPNFFNNFSALEITNQPNLSPREEEVLNLLSTGLTRREVANNLYISVETVNFHCKNLLKKFQTNKMHLLINKAREMNLIS